MIYTLSFSLWFCFSILSIFSRLFSLSSEQKGMHFSIVNRSSFIVQEKNTTSLILTIAHISMSTNVFCPGDRRLLFRWTQSKKHNNNTTSNKQTNKWSEKAKNVFILWKQFFCLNDRKKASQKEDVNKTHGDDYYSFVWIPILLFALLFYDAVYFALFFLIVNIIVEKKVLSKLYTDVK